MSMFSSLPFKSLLAKGITALMLLSVTSPLLWVLPQPLASAASLRIKDISHIKGVRENQIVGYGLVVGLNRTGDQSRSTLNAEFNFIRNMGGRLQNQNDIRSTNTAAVVVTATIPPFSKSGDRIDVLVSSMADAKSLEGGTLVVTQLMAPNGEVVALAQGPISTGGTSVDAGGSSTRTSITTTGRIPQGAIMERDMYTEIGDDFGVDLILDRTDFSMAARVAKAVKAIAPAKAMDGSSVRVTIPDEFIDDKISFLAQLETIRVESIDDIAKVVVNERTGTIVIGNGVRLLPAAVAHGGITVKVQTTNSVSQPGAFSPGGQTVGVTNSDIEVVENPGSLIELGGNASLGDLVGALNALGVTPNDLISILQALKNAGSLEAKLEII